MSVYTTVKPEDVTPLLSDFGLGELKALEGIQEGMENTNYRLYTSQGAFVLTLFESHEMTQLGFYMVLLTRLHEAGVPVALPRVDLRGRSVVTVKDKPAGVFPMLAGSWVSEPGENHLFQVGKAMGRMHQLSPVPAHVPDNNWGLARWIAEKERLSSLLTADEVKLLDDELRFQTASNESNHELQAGVIHADLFRDNVLFDGERLSGLIDFYMACRGAFVYDLAVVVNDWCLDINGTVDTRRVSALIRGYQQQRSLTDAERHALPGQLRAAALRFWLSRLNEHYLARSGDMALLKDPGQFRSLLEQHRLHTHSLGDLFIDAGL